jgi:hypothetical protein
LIDEVEHLCRVKNTYAFFFSDHLINGSLRELRAFCREVIKRDIKIKWTGFCRFDTLMDRPFYEELGLSGCVSLVYGAESGSQRVLNLMNKGISIEEMERNLRDSRAVGMQAMTNWLVGFPGEKPQDFAETLTFIWRNRNRNIIRINRRAFSPRSESLVGQNPESFAVSGLDFGGQWILRDFSFGPHHMRSRLLYFDIFFEMLLTEKPVSRNSEYMQDHSQSHYQIVFDNPERQSELEYEDFDYEIIKTELNPYADTLVNEIWPLLRVLWRARGGFSTQITQSFSNYSARWDFKITDTGLWQASVAFSFSQQPGAFTVRDIKPADSIAQQRARRLAKPTHTINPKELREQAEHLNRECDFSFEHSWQGQGQW